MPRRASRPAVANIPAETAPSPTDPGTNVFGSIPRSFVRFMASYAHEPGLPASSSGVSVRPSRRRTPVTPAADSVSAKVEAEVLPKPRFRVMVVGAADGDFLPEPIFDSAAAAAAYCKEQKAKGTNLRMVREYSSKEVLAGKRRERDRFASGDYKALPDWFTEAYSKPDQFAHWSKQDHRANEGYIAYSPTPEHLVDDKQVTLLASTYLAREFDHLPGNEISQIHSRLINSRKAADLCFTRDPAVVKEAYINKEHCAESSNYPSCMRYEPENFELPPHIHPVDAYVGPDSTFSLAYLRRQSDKEITARAIVSETAKTYIKVYGFDESDRVMLMDMLKAKGYRRVDNFAGERLHIMKHPRFSKQVIVPYMDGTAVSCMPDGLICEGSRGAIDLAVTSGYATVASMENCHHCGIATRQRSMIFFEESMWCLPCAQRYLYSCGYDGTWHSRQAEPPIVVYYSTRSIRYTTLWSPQSALAEAFKCQHTNQFYAKAAFNVINVVTLSGIETWCAEVTAFARRAQVVGKKIIYYDLAAWAAHTGEPLAREPRVGDIMRVATQLNSRYWPCISEVGTLVELVELCPTENNPRSYRDFSNATRAVVASVDPNWSQCLYQALYTESMPWKCLELVTAVEDRQPLILTEGADVYNDGGCFKLFPLEENNFDDDEVSSNPATPCATMSRLVVTGVRSEEEAAANGGGTHQVSIWRNPIYRGGHDQSDTVWVSPAILREWIWK